MEHFDIDVIGAAIAAVLAITYVVRMEGKLNLLQEILSRVEDRQIAFETRYNIDGQYTTVHRRAGHQPAE